MKLRNKKTGEIRELPDGFFCGDNLKKICEEWEDYEEPEEYWRITDLGELKSIRLDQHHQNIEKCKQIGNYFETKEEAEQAVEKLKAFKRLQDLGFRFDGIRFRDKYNYIEWKIKANNELTDAEIEEFREGLHKVFGSKDEEWELIKEVPKAVQELSDKITDKVMECVEEYLPKKLPKGAVVKYYEMTKPEIEKTLVWLNGKFEDPFVTVPAVNALLRILGYVDLFVYDDDNGHVYHFNMIEERNKYESDKQMATR